MSWIHPGATFFRVQIAVSYYGEHKYDCAATVAKAIVESYPEYHLTYRWLAAALGQLGQAGHAGEMLHKAMEIAPDSFMRHVRRRPRWFRAEDHQHMLDGLRKAGWTQPPDPPGGASG
jgi:adenylate cyclase